MPIFDSEVLQHRLQRIGEWERITVIPAWKPARALC
jgi:hypothetical protein